MSGGDWFTVILVAWAAAGYLSAMLLLIGAAVRLPMAARFVAFLPVAAGLVAAGALSANTLRDYPGPDGIVRVGFGLLTPVFFLLTQAATSRKAWRLWLGVHVLAAALAALFFSQAFR